MTIIEHDVSPEASEFIESYWSVPAKHEFVLIPDGVYNLIIGEVEIVGDQNRFSKPDRVLKLPLLRSALFLKARTDLFIVRIKAFVHPKQSNSKTFIQSLQQARFSISQKYGPDAPLELAESLCHFYSLYYHRRPILTEIVNEILQNRGQVELSSLYDKLKLSKQSITKTYASLLGISLKQLCTIWRLNDALIHTTETKNLTAAFLMSGFFDQAHGSKYFKKYFNLPLSRFLSENAFHMPSILMPIRKRFDGTYDPIRG